VAICSGAPREGEQGRIVTVPKFVCLKGFSKNPHGSTQYPLFRTTVLAISPPFTMPRMTSSSEAVFVSTSEPLASTQQAKDTMLLMTSNREGIFVSDREPLVSTQQAPAVVKQQTATTRFAGSRQAQTEPKLSKRDVFTVDALVSDSMPCPASMQSVFQVSLEVVRSPTVVVLGKNRVYLPTAVHATFAQVQASLLGATDFPVTNPLLICVNGIEFEAWNAPVLKPSTIALDTVQSFSVSTALGELCRDISPKVATPGPQCTTES